MDIVDYFKLDEEDDDEEEMDEYGNTSNTTTPKHKLKIFVIDSHRPLNLQNIYAVGSDQVVVLDDGDIEDMTHVKEAYDALLVRDKMQVCM